MKKKEIFKTYSPTRHVKYEAIDFDFSNKSFMAVKLLSDTWNDF